MDEHTQPSSTIGGIVFRNRLWRRLLELGLGHDCVVNLHTGGNRLEDSFVFLGNDEVTNLEILVDKVKGK